MRTETTERTLYKFDELSEAAQDKAIENLYDCNVDYDWWDFDNETFFGFSSDECKANRGIRGCPRAPLSYKTLYFAIDQSWFIQLPDLHIVDLDTFRKWLHIPTWLIDNLSFSFDHQGREGNTRLTIELEHPTRYDFTPRELKIVERAQDICNDKIDDALRILRDEYEYRTGREAILETIEANDYEFDAKGNLA